MEIMVAYDGSNVADDALQLAQNHAVTLGGTLHVVTSMKGGRDVPRKEFERAERKLRQAEMKCLDQKIACKTYLSVQGLEPGEDLVCYARENKIDEIIIGVRRRSRVGKLLFGSTAQQVILDAPCPVITVK